MLINFLYIFEDKYTTPKMNVLNNSYPCFSQNEGFIFVKQRQLKNQIFMGYK